MSYSYKSIYPEYPVSMDHIVTKLYLSDEDSLCVQCGKALMGGGEVDCVIGFTTGELTGSYCDQSTQPEIQLTLTCGCGFLGKLNCCVIFQAMVQPALPCTCVTWHAVVGDHLPCEA